MHRRHDAQAPAPVVVVASLCDRASPATQAWAWATWDHREAPRRVRRGVAFRCRSSSSRRRRSPPGLPAPRRPSRPPPREGGTCKPATSQRRAASSAPPRPDDRPNSPCEVPSRGRARAAAAPPRGQSCPARAEERSPRPRGRRRAPACARPRPCATWSRVGRRPAAAGTSRRGPRARGAPPSRSGGERGGSFVALVCALAAHNLCRSTLVILPPPLNPLPPLTPRSSRASVGGDFSGSLGIPLRVRSIAQAASGSHPHH